MLESQPDGHPLTMCNIYHTMMIVSADVTADNSLALSEACMSVTLSDVAKRAGVSGKTVSRVVNGDKEVSEGTRQRILQIIDEMDYVLHINAQRLASGKTRSIARHYSLSNPSLFSEQLEMNFIMGTAMGASEHRLHHHRFVEHLGRSRSHCPMGADFER